MVTEEQFVEEFTDLAATAGIDRTCQIDFPRYMSERHRRDGRSYAEVDPYEYRFNFAREILLLPREHRRGLIMHEIGHCLCPSGSEDDADRVAAQVFGHRIQYDPRWPGKGLQCVARGGERNPADGTLRVRSLRVSGGPREFGIEVWDETLSRPWWRILERGFGSFPEAAARMRELKQGLPQENPTGGHGFEVGDGVLYDGDFFVVYTATPQKLRLQDPASGRTVMASPGEVYKANPPMEGTPEEIAEAFYEIVAPNQGDWYPIKPERVREALDTLLEANNQGWIKNVTLKDARDRLNSAFENAQRTLLDGYPDNSGLHYAKSELKKLEKRAGRDTPYQQLLRVGAALDQFTKDLKKLIVKRPPGHETKAAKQAKLRATREDVKTCAVCFGDYVITKSGRPKRHGFSIVTSGRGHGHLGAWHTGPCMGSDYLHYGLSSEGTQAALAATERQLGIVERRLEELQTRPPLKWTWEPSSYAVRRGDKPKTFTIMPGDQASYGDPGTPSYDRLHQKMLNEAEKERKTLIDSIAFYEQKIRDWKPEAKQNPPYSGYDKTYFQKPLPKDPTKIAYKTKRDALNVFIDWNRAIIDDYGGADMKHSPESFEAINHRFDIQGRRRVDTIAKALWWALPPGSPYYLEDIDVELLNRTAPAIYNQDGRTFSIPDYAEERRLLEQEAEHWERYRDIEYPEEDDLADVPF